MQFIWWMQNSMLMIDVFISECWMFACDMWAGEMVAVVYITWRCICGLFCQHDIQDHGSAKDDDEEESETMKLCLHGQQCVCGYEAVSTLTTVCVRLWSRVYTDNSVCAVMKPCLHWQQCMCHYEAVSTRTTVCVPRCRFVCYNSCMELWLTLFIWYQMNNVQHRKVILSQACYDLGNTTFQLLSHSQFVWTTLTSVCITFLQISITVGDFSNDRQFLAETLDLLLISKFSFCCLVGLVRICLQLEIRPKIWFNPSLKYSIWYWNVILQAFFLISRRPDLLLIENHLIFVHLFRFYDGPSS